MAKPRKKKRTHVPAQAPAKQAVGTRPPKSMVIRMGAGEIGSSISQLVKDFRSIMEPDTASRLKERKNNKLKDYTAMTGPLGVTHLFLFSRSKNGNTHLRVALTPRGPTLTFRVVRYALSKDVAKSQKHPRAGGTQFLTAPLLVMNNFSTQASGSDPDPVKQQLESLTTTVFQSMFPPISPQKISLSSVQRILLLNREPSTAASGNCVITLRHYAITTRSTGVSKRIRRFDASEQRKREKKTGVALPNLGQLSDAAEYLLDPSAGGYTSASETELDTDAEVEVLETTARKVLGRREREKIAKVENGKLHAPEKRANVEKRAVKLVELGPRMKLRMVKVEEGICEGRVMWNEFVSKSKVEEKNLEEKWEVRRKEKERRKEEQKENVRRKRELKANTKNNTGENGEAVDEEAEGWDSEDFDDDDNYGFDDGSDKEEEQDEDEEMED